MSLSVCLLTRNDEEHLARALRSVAGVADEVVVADTGSRDRTVQIATELGARVLQFAWEDDFGAGRNFLIGQAREMDSLAECRRGAAGVQPLGGPRLPAARRRVRLFCPRAAPDRCRAVRRDGRFAALPPPRRPALRRPPATGSPGGGGPGCRARGSARGRQLDRAPLLRHDAAAQRGQAPLDLPPAGAGARPAARRLTVSDRVRRHAVAR